MKKRFGNLSKAEQEKIELEYHQMNPDEFDGEMAKAKKHVVESIRLPALKRSRIGRNESCPCGSGDKYKRCHGKESEPSNPSPQPVSPVRGSLKVELVDPPQLLEVIGPREVEPRPIGERNKLLVDAIDDIFGPLGEKNWDRIKKGIEPTEIRRLYEAVGAIWPPNTDLAASLPKNNKLRGLYLGDVE